VSADFPGHGAGERHGDDAFGSMPGDLLGDIASSEPGLDALLGMLTADPTPDELAGENAALTMFRAHRRPTAPPAAPPADLHRRRRLRAGIAAAAVTLAAAAGFAVAAYTEALPAPLQHAAYQVLGFAGVPSVHHAAPSAAAYRPPGPARQRGGSPAAGGSPGPAASASPRPGGAAQPPAPGQEELSITAASGRVAAGAGDTFAGRLTGQGGAAVQGKTLNLLERAAGQSAWHLAGTGTTGGNGGAAVTVADLTRNAAFRLKAPDGALSGPVLVIVAPTVTARAGGPGGRPGVITASCRLGIPGDTVVLQAQSGARWLSLQKASLNKNGQAVFTVQGRAGRRAYRVVLLPTVAQGTSVSNTVRVPAR
jgi:hypothetical protein